MEKNYFTIFLCVAPLVRTNDHRWQASVVDDFIIPQDEKSGRVGALMPYTRYDSEEALLGGGDATLKTSKDWNCMNIATQASLVMA